MIADFHFLRPAWLLLLLPLIVLWWRLLRGVYDRDSWRGAIDNRLLPFVLSNRAGSRQTWMRWIFAAAALLAIVALAGPTWEKLPRPVYLKQSALIIALDLSRSMDAADIKPSRLARARHKIADILKLRTEGQTALVVYAADAFAVTPLTSDTDTILALLPALDSGMMPAQGSRADRALGLAFELFENSGIARGDLLLISDGIDDGELQRIEAEFAGGRGHRLSVLAIGTPDGGPIPLEEGGFLQDRSGAIVVAAMREDSLRRAAQLGGGVYATISSDDIDINTLAYLLESGIDERSLREAEYSADLWRELGPWLLLAALPCAALAFRRGLIWMLPLLLLAPPQDALALDWQSWWLNQDQRAHQLYEQGEHEAAADLFGDPDWRASSRYRAGDYEAALEAWQAQETETALYNRGNALARLGRFEQALAAYERLLRDNPAHADALHNKQAVEQFLEQRQQQQQGAQQGGESSAGDQDARQQGGSQQGQQGGSQQGQADGSQDQPPQTGIEPDENRQQGGQGENRQQARNEAPSSGDEQAAGEAAAGSDEARQQQAQTSRSGDEDAADGDSEELASVDEKMSMQAAQQWLRKIPDDPGGLLRRKFLYQYRQRGGADAESEPW